MPEVSVIMPVYNKAAYLAEAIASVQAQVFTDFELILVNDGSTDGSLSIALEFAGRDPRIRVIDIPNGGVSHARNVGLSHAGGRWIQFLDADDLLEPDYLTEALGVLEEDPADILFSGFTMIDGSMRPVREVCLQETGIKDQEALCRCFARYQYETGFFGFISNKLFSRALWERSGAVFPVGTTLAEDLDFYARLYPCVEQAYFWQGNSFRYRQTESNYTHNGKIDYGSQLEIHLDIKAWFQKAGLYPEYQELLDGKVAQYAAFVLFHGNEAGEDMSRLFAGLRSREEIMECIEPQYVGGFYRLVLRALKQGCYPGMKMLFAVRNAMRALYRSVKKHE